METVATLSEQQLFGFRQAFSSVDHDNDGLVHTKDLPLIFKRLDESLISFIVEGDELEHLINQTDICDTEQITFAQFLVLIACKINVNDTVEELQEAFHIFDPMNTGFITAKDLRRVMQDLGENISEIEAEQMMQEADRDLDGKISFGEFFDMIQYR